MSIEENAGLSLSKNKLPKSWDVCVIEDLCAYIQRGKSPKYTEKSDLPVINQKCIRWDELQSEHLKYIHPSQWEKWDEIRFVRNGDILWNSTGTGTIGRAYCFSDSHRHDRIVADSHVTILRSHVEIDPKFLYYYIRSSFIQKQIEDMQTGSTGQVELGKKVICGTVAPLAPANEQPRIVSKIEELFSDLDKGEENLRRVQKLIGCYRQSVLKAAVTGELTRDWREKDKDSMETGEQLLKRILKVRRKAWEKAELAKMQAKGQKPKNDKWKEKYKEPVGPDTSELPELPEGWVWANLEQLTGLITSGSRGWAKYYSESGATFIRAQDIKTDKLVTNNIAYVSLPDGVEGTRTRVENEDILVTITGANVTKTALIQDELEEAYVSQHVALVRPVDTGLTEYMFNWIICPTHGRRELEKKAYGAGKPGLSLENLRELTVALPPKEEQEEILIEIDRVLTTIAGSDKDLATYSITSTDLRQSILKAAFSGKLVPQDPNDEPASELLKRIAEEKAKAEAAKPKRGGPKKKAAPKGKKTLSKLATARKKAGLTQAKLAKAAGINPAYISPMENGRRAITPEQAEKLAGVLGVTAQALTQ